MDDFPTRRFATAAAALLASALGFALTGPTTGEKWVVEGSGYSGPRSESGPGGRGDHYVRCVPAADLDLPTHDRQRWRQIKVPYEGAYDWEKGQPCPDGPVLIDSTPSYR